MLNVTTGWNNLETIVDNLDFANLKTAPADFKKLSDEVVKNTKFNAVNQ